MNATSRFDFLAWATSSALAFRIAAPCLRIAAAVACSALFFTEVEARASSRAATRAAAPRSLM